MKVLIILIFSFCLSSSFAQVSYYADKFNGGVTGGGYGPDYGFAGTGTINVQIAAGSTIRKAYLFAGRQGAAPPLSITFNGNALTFNSTNQVSPTFQSPSYGGASGVHAIDVTSLVSASVSAYTLVVSDQNSKSNRFSEFYLFIAYNNASLPFVNTEFFVNDKDFATVGNYSFNLTNPVNSSIDVGVGLFLGYQCFSFDFDSVKLNGNYLGMAYDNESNSGLCAGPFANFYYSNNALGALGDDNANQAVNGKDVLINAKALIPNNSTSFNMQFIHKNNDNARWGFFVVNGGNCTTPNAGISPSTSTICSGKSGTLTASGGTTYAWSNGGNTAAINVSPTQNTTYTVTVTLGGNCSATASASVVVAPVPLVNATATPTNCGFTTGTATAAPTGGTGPYNYNWNTTPPQNTQQATGLSSGAYIVTVTDSKQCTATTTASVGSVGGTDTAKVTITTSDTAACTGKTITFNAIAAFGGTAPFYQWKINGVNAGTNSSTFSSSNISHRDTVTCILTSNQPCINGSPAKSNSVIISIYPRFQAGAIGSVPDSICKGVSALLSVSGNSAAVQWQKSSTGTGYADIPGANTSTLSDSPAQTTYYRVYGSNGYCSDTSVAFKLFVKPLPAAPALTAADTVICSGESVQICAPDTFLSYNWNNGGAANCTQATFAGGYWVSVTAANGCSTISQRKNISVYPVPSVSIIRQGDTLSSFGAVTYQWYLNGAKIDGATSAIYIVKEPGDYSLEITDGNGCKATSRPAVFTGLNDFMTDGSLELFPNPASDNIQLKATSRWIGEEYQIYDVIGQAIEWGSIRSELTIVDVSKISTGLYFLKVNEAVIRFMKQ